MKSEQLNKISLLVAEWKTGSPAIGSTPPSPGWLWVVTLSLLAWFIAWVKGMEEDNNKTKKWKKYVPSRHHMVPPKYF